MKSTYLGRSCRSLPALAPRRLHCLHNSPMAPSYSSCLRCRPLPSPGPAPLFVGGAPKPLDGMQSFLRARDARSSPWSLGASFCWMLRLQDGGSGRRSRGRADAFDVPHRLPRRGLRSLRGARPMGRVCLGSCCRASAPAVAWHYMQPSCHMRAAQPLGACNLKRAFVFRIL